VIDPAELNRERMELYSLARTLAETLREQTELLREAGDEDRYAEVRERLERVEATIRRILDRLAEKADRAGIYDS